MSDRQDSHTDRTRTSLPEQSGQSPPRSMSVSGTVSGGRFLAGTVVAERYRIVGLLGRGGMGEVYRADDLTLDQPVALKFLPPELSADQDRLERLLHEVKIARQVSHPNVCRVYDVGRVEGATYLSMEYIDGEDLSTLLRRIGRLPEDKATDIARQLCAGLSAAHTQGIVHRDLKPANVMLDGEGKARITDFGLAGVASSIQGVEIHAGTPDYMAPEQLAGESVSIQSDLYALGLLLYELFTGKRPFDAKSVGELREQQRSVTPTGLTTHVPTLDPAIERVIGRCLDPDPSRRPASALAVAAALPGGDPLAAALAAGETPSPEIVAASGAAERLSPLFAIGSVVGVAALLVVSVVMADELLLVRHIDPAKSHTRLAVEARGLLEQIGHAEEPTDTAFGFLYNRDYVSWRGDDDSVDRWDDIAEVRPSSIVFWYRESPRPLIGIGSSGVSAGNPPLAISAMRRLFLDHDGHLLRYESVPPEVTAAFRPISFGEEPSDEAPTEPVPAAPVDWSPLIEAAGFEPDRLTETEPQWNPLLDTDERIAWTGSYPGRPETMRIEAGAYRGEPVFFNVVPPWERPARMQQQPMNTAVRVILSVLLAIFFLILFSALWLARRNMRRDRNDRRGAWRLALYTFALVFGIWLLGSHHSLSLGLFGQFLFNGVGSSLVFALIVWLLYTALEPYVRKLWPEILVSWTRVLGGRFRDPLVGKHLLLGCLYGSVGLVLLSLARLVPGWLGKAPPAPFAQNMLALDGMRGAMAMLLSMQLNAIGIPLALLFMLVLLRQLTRRKGVALGIMIALAVGLGALLAQEWWLLGMTIFGGYWTLLLLTITRLGLLPGAIMHIVANSAWAFPLTLDLSASYAPMGLLFPLSIVALAAFAAWTSMNRERSLAALFDD